MDRRGPHVDALRYPDVRPRAAEARLQTAATRPRVEAEELIDGSAGRTGRTPPEARKDAYASEEGSDLGSRGRPRGRGGVDGADVGPGADGHSGRHLGHDREGLRACSH